MEKEGEGSWEEVESVLLPNIQKTQSQRSSAFNLLFDSGSLKPIGPTIFKINELTATLIEDSRMLKSEDLMGRKSFSVNQGDVEVHFDER